MHLSTVQKRSAEFHHSAENPKPTRTQLNAGSIYLVSENDPQGSEVGIATIACNHTATSHEKHIKRRPIVLLGDFIIWDRSLK